MTYAQASFRGSREINEDSVVFVRRNDCFCAAVADGLGAHGRGDVASRIFVEVFEREFYQAGEKSGDFFVRAFCAAQREILAGQMSKNEMKTTGVALAMIDGKWNCGHIGDSRLYYFHKGKLRQRTIDHSVPQMLGIREDEIPNHPDRNKLLRVLGDSREEPGYELMKERRVSKNDAFLLCSDGFWEHFSADFIAARLKESQNAQMWLASMLASVDWDGPEQDNYTAITVMI